jgi:hypothetical protein
LVSWISKHTLLDKSGAAKGEHMLNVRMNTMAEKEPADPRFGIYLIDVSTGQVTYLDSQPATSPRSGFHPTHLSYDPAAQRQKKNSQ